ncbi:MAG: helix-turn-helix transcriptional regulator [Bacilli bacterium]|nr:helix-turn-helix transcriptional regulator [Bacilli bacterium]
MLESKELFNRILKAKNLTIYRLSKISGIPKSTLSDLASGNTSIYKASLKTISKLSLALECSVEDLLEGNIFIEESLKDLPPFLVSSIEKMIEAWRHIELNDGYTLWDCDYCELQSEINIAEVEGLITSQRAWELREKYLKISRGEII